MRDHHSHSHWVIIFIFPRVWCTSFDRPWLKLRRLKNVIPVECGAHNGSCQMVGTWVGEMGAWPVRVHRGGCGAQIKAVGPNWLWVPGPITCGLESVVCGVQPLWWWWWWVVLFSPSCGWLFGWVGLWSGKKERLRGPFLHCGPHSAYAICGPPSRYLF